MAGRRGRMFDHASAGRALSYPGIDPRTWVSFGRVDPDSPEAGDEGRSVQFDAEDGQIYVNVTLKPSEMQVRARVGMAVAGPGEAMYFPLVAEDEVLVVLPGGDPRAGATIVARLNNRLDPFPQTSVAGTDPALNSFGMIRTKAAFVVESGQSIMLRSAAAGAFLRLDAKGGVTLRDGDADALSMDADVFGYQSGDGSATMQIDLNEQRYTLKVGQASLLLAGDLVAANAAGTPSGSFLMVPDSLTVSAGGAPPNATVEHVVTTEALGNILVALGALIAPPVIPVQVAAAFTTAAATPLDPAVATAIQAAFLVQPPKLPGVPGLGQTVPGIGCPAFIAG